MCCRNSLDSPHDSLCRCSVGSLFISTAQPLVLLGHFFAVAGYGVYHMLSRCESVLEYPVALVKSMFVMKSAVGVIVPLTWNELKVILLPW